MALLRATKEKICIGIEKYKGNHKSSLRENYSFCNKTDNGKPLRKRYLEK